MSTPDLPIERVRALLSYAYTFFAGECSGVAIDLRLPDGALLCVRSPRVGVLPASWSDLRGVRVLLLRPLGAAAAELMAPGPRAA